MHTAIPTHLSVPLNWSVDQHRNLPYKKDTHRDAAQLDAWETMGYHRDSITMFTHQLPNPENWFAYLIDYFSFLSELRFAFHKLTPGHYLPTHSDSYGFYKKQQSINDSNQIMRYIVFLEDWQEGHLLTIEDHVYTKWAAGDCVGWKGETMHAAINLGTVDRYTMQITGKLIA
jgi:hypothetical protein